MKYLLFCLMLAGCTYKPVYYIQQDFVTYVDSFDDEAARHGYDTHYPDLIVEFDSLPSYVNGECHTSTHRAPTILINKTIWDNSSTTFREILIYHELGHCLLGRKHDTNFKQFEDGSAPESIMYPMITFERFYEKYRTYYLDELFSI